MQAQNLTLSTTSGNVGASVTVTVSSILPNVPVVITYDGFPVANGTSWTNGTFKAVFAIPASVRGAHTVRASDGVSSPSTTFTVTSSIARTPTSGAVRSVVTLTGYGFLAASSITVKWDGTFMATSPGSITPDANGSFIATFLVPPGEPVAHNLEVIEFTSYWTTYTITRSILLSPTSNLVGTDILVTGSGFLASSPIALTLDGASLTTVPAAIVSDGVGEFSAVFKVPYVPTGSKTVRATDSMGSSATAALTVSSNLTLSYYSAEVGTSVRITGYGFTPLDNVTVTYDGSLLLTTDTDSTGYFRRTFLIPPSPAGSHSIVANDTSGMSTNATFTVVSNVALSATSGSVGTLVSVSGTGFASLSPVTLSFRNMTMTTTPTTLLTDSLGNFAGTFIVPQTSPGGWGVMVKDAQGFYDEAIFTIIRKISLSASSGYVGTNITVKGTDFSPMSTINLSFDSVSIATDPVSIITDSQGRFIGTFIVPEALNGYHILMANDSTCGSVSLSFAVSALIELLPSAGNNGTSVLISGTGFGPNTLVDVTFGGMPLSSSPSSGETNGVGTFSASFTVDSTTAGARTVRATDLFGNTDTATFTVIRQITPSDSSVNVLQAITITGVGFSNFSTIDLTWSGSPISPLPALLSTDAVGGFTAILTIPLDACGQHTITATDGDDNSASANVTIWPSMTLMPAGQIVGDTLWVRGDGFDSLTDVEVAWDGTHITTEPTTLATDSFGSFNATFIIPPSTYGSHRVTVADQSGHSTYSSYSISLSSNLNIVIDVGSLYFPGEVAEFYVLCAQSGKPFNATAITAKLFMPGGSSEDVTSLVTNVDTGTYRIDYTLPGCADAGTYALVANVSKDFSGVTYFGSDLRVFEVSGTFEHMNATLTSINDTLASISIDIGPVLLRLDQVNASLSSLISDAEGHTLAAIATSSGTILSRLDLLNVSLSSINDGIATVTSALGTIQVNISSMGAKIASMEGTLVNVSTVLGTIHASISDLNPRLAAIEDGVLLIQTDLGDIQLVLDDIQTRSISMEGTLVRIETRVDTILVALENLTGIAIPIETTSGTYMATLFTNTILTSADYVSSSQSICVACQCSGSQSHALSLIVPKAALDRLNTSPSSFKLMVNSKESLFSITNASSAYIVQAHVEQGLQEVVLYLSGLPPPFTTLTLLASALVILLLASVMLAWVRWKRIVGAAAPKL